MIVAVIGGEAAAGRRGYGHVRQAHRCRIQHRACRVRPRSVEQCQHGKVRGAGAALEALADRLQNLLPPRLGGPIALQVANRDYANWEERMNPWPVPDGVAATVNGRPIYYTEIDSNYKSQFPSQGEGENQDQIQLRRMEILGSLIDNEIMFQRAEKASLVATDAD